MTATSLLYGYDKGVSRTANLSSGDGGLYRYRLSRVWDEKWRQRVVFVMLNPSVADATIDDPTIRKCRVFAARWGYGGIIVLNLFAFRATYPEELLECMKAGGDPIGPENDDFIRREAWAAHASGSPIVAAWGANEAIKIVDSRRSLRSRVEEVKELLWTYVSKVYRIGPATKDGHPRHPLYLPYRSGLELLE